MKTKNEIHRELLDEYLSHDSISKEAYRIWESEDRPDGETALPRAGMKVKEWHWYLAKWQLDILAELDADIIWACSYWSDSKIEE